MTTKQKVKKIKFEIKNMEVMKHLKHSGYWATIPSDVVDKIDKLYRQEMEKERKEMMEKVKDLLDEFNVLKTDVIDNGIKITERVEFGKRLNDLSHKKQTKNTVKQDGNKEHEK